MTDFQTAVAKFHDNDLEVITVAGSHAFTAETVGKALGYSEPRIAINKIFTRRKHEFKLGADYSVTNLVTEVGERPTTVFFLTGVILLCMFSDQPVAVEFREWAKHVLANQEPAARAEWSHSFQLTKQEISVPVTEYIGLLKNRIEFLETVLKTPRLNVKYSLGSGETN